MSFTSLEQGIAAVQAGNLVEGARLIRISLRSEALNGNVRAMAYLWLAETQTDLAFKRSCYTEALTADPTSQDAQQRLSALLAAQLPPPPAPVSLPETPRQPVAPPPPPVAAQPIPQAVDLSKHLAAVIGGPHGPGTAFFVAPDGLLATTRHIVGGLERVTIELQPGRQLPGQVIRSYPELDLAFIRVDQGISELLPITPQATVPDEAPLLVIAYGNHYVQGRQRVSRRIVAAHWISTDIKGLPDGGGCPIFDERYYLVGMMTSNTSRTSEHYYGLHVSAIRKSLESYRAEMMTRRGYCPNCGSVSQATAAGYFYCEICGSVAPQAQHVVRYAVPQAVAYYEPNSTRCTECGATAGFYNRRCLRCGQEMKNN